MPTILILNGDAHGIPAEECATYLETQLPEATILRARSRNEEADLLPEAEIAVGGSLRAELLPTADRLRLFACSSAGVGHLDLAAFEEHGVAVTNASGVHGSNIAEHVIGWLLMIARRLDEGLRRQRRSEWRHFQATDDFEGSRVAVVGLGAIGQAIVERLRGFGVETVGVRYTPAKGGPTDEVVGFEDLDSALIGTDYLVIASPLTDTTRGLIGQEELETLPPDAVVVNVGRGPIIETDPLVRALRGNKLHAAALDVTDPEPLPADHPLWDLGNCYLTPHNSGYTPAYWERVGDILLENLERLEAEGSEAALRNQIV